MKIGIELRHVTLGHAGGISQLLKGVLQELIASATLHEFIVFCTIFNRSLVACDADNVRFMSLPLHSFLGEVDRICDEENIDVLFRSYPMEDNLRFPLSKQIFLIPDIQHETYPEFFEAKVLRTRRAPLRVSPRRRGGWRRQTGSPRAHRTRSA